MRLVVALLEAKVHTGCCDPSLLSSSIAVLSCLGEYSTHLNVFVSKKGECCETFTM